MNAEHYGRAGANPPSLTVRDHVYTCRLVPCFISFFPQLNCHHGHVSLPTPPQAYLSFLCCFRSLRFLSRSLLLLSLSSLLCCDSESGDLERCHSDNFRSLCWRKRGSAGPSWRFRSLSWRFCSLSVASLVISMAAFTVS